MALSDMERYEDDIYTSTIELLGQKLEAFNAASNNAAVLSMAAWRGSYSKEAFFSQLAGAQRRVNRLSANATQAATTLSMGENVGVKVAGGFGPVLFEPAQISWINEDPVAAISAIAEGFADALLADQLNAVIGAAVAAVENNSALVNDVSATTGLSQTVLNGSHAKFTDMSGLLRTDFMTGGAYHNLIDKALANGEQLFDSTSVTVVSILGKTIVVSDIPALYEAGTPNKTKVLSVVSMGIICDNAGDIITNMETSNGKNRIETTWQADYSFGVKLKGYSWDTTNGGESPTDAALFTGSNWDKSVAEDKHTLGTLAIADADQ